MTVPVAAITPQGMTVPSYADILAALTAGVQAIYGSDVVLTPDSQDGQLLAIFAQALADSNATAQDVFNAFSPSTAQGAGLSSVVKINGIQRNVASFSTATVTLTGVAGTIITGGIVGDNLGRGTRWSLTSPVTIGGGGTINATATCSAEGATPAPANTLTQILTPTLGWQSVTNASAATAGNAVETDAALRMRQSRSVSIAAETMLDAIYSAIANVTGVDRLAVYENDTDSTDGNGIPSHSIAAVVDGGDPVAIATAIAETKSPGTGTAGTTTEVITDPKGVPNTIKFYPLTEVTITVALTVNRLPGWVVTTQDAIKASIAAYLSGLAIGEHSYLARLYSAANLEPGLGDTFVVTALTQSRSGPPTAADVTIAFNEAAVCAIGNITITLT